jgi:hydrogenase expression/formation protein HypD
MDEMTESGIENVKLLTALKRTIPAVDWICENESIDGFLCPGHVSVITGVRVWAGLARKHDRPFVVAGFEGAHLINAIYELVRMAEAAEYLTANCYSEAAAPDGNPRARAAVAKYFMEADAVWRGLGTLPCSGYILTPEFANFQATDHNAQATPRDARRGETATSGEYESAAGCRCADVLTGRIDPSECGLFKTVCRPENAIGPCMVSAEGACGIWYRNLI